MGMSEKTKAGPAGNRALTPTLVLAGEEAAMNATPNPSDPPSRKRLRPTRLETLDDLRRRCTVDANGCWVWPGAPKDNGYGRGTLDGSRMYIHRIAYILGKGPIPDDMTVDHMCFNRICANPSHLRLLTLSDNASNQQRKYDQFCLNGLHPKTPEYRYKPPNGREGCVPCRNDARRRWIEDEENRERRNALKRAWVDANRDRVNANYRAARLRRIANGTWKST